MKFEKTYTFDLVPNKALQETAKYALEVMDEIEIDVGNFIADQLPPCGTPTVTITITIDPA